MTQHPHPNLGTPSKLVDGGLRIVALGGISEIGRNMTVYETNGKLLIIDCGVLFRLGRLSVDAGAGTDAGRFRRIVHGVVLCGHSASAGLRILGDV